MSKALIGIISYLPDDKEIRSMRLYHLNQLIRDCNRLFNLPIYIVIQNYTEEDIKNISGYPNVQLSSPLNKLGILFARKILREIFLTMNYDTLIMLDDDCILNGTEADGKEYLKQLEEHPGCFGEFNLTLLKLFSISKDLLEKEDYPEVNPENGEGFEDRAFVEMLRFKYPDRRFIYNTNIQEESITTDKLSTWYNGQNLSSMIENTKEIIENIKHSC